MAVEAIARAPSIRYPESEYFTVYVEERRDLSILSHEFIFTLLMHPKHGLTEDRYMSREVIDSDLWYREPAIHRRRAQDKAIHDFLPIILNRMSVLDKQVPFRMTTVYGCATLSETACASVSI